MVVNNKHLSRNQCNSGTITDKKLVLSKDQQTNIPLARPGKKKKREDSTQFTNHRNETGTSLCDRNFKDYNEIVYNKNNSMPTN